jgi:HD-GYP domain-containing protein (c-di-GMP phosphodiesterase class II)
MAHEHDSLELLNGATPLHEKLLKTHRALQAHLPFIKRIAIALYDPKTTLLKTYLHSSGEDNPLPNYQAQLAEAPSLAAILAQGRPRVINNMLTFEKGTHEHTLRIGRQGYAASYTLPMFGNGVFFGFIFFNASETDVFTDHVLEQLDVFGHLISLLVMNEITSMRTLVAAVTSASYLTHQRDPETGSHLDRMSRYARLIAQTLAARHALEDEYIERIFMFSPLHDIGKIGIPDHVLLKRGGLDPEETALMRSHTSKGREIIDDLLINFGLDAIQHVDILRNIAQYHHEQIDGGGYPDGLQGDAIPLEARIVAVADVFDALTSRRPYKDAWSNDDAYAMLNSLAGEKLDAECVQAMLENRAQVEQIQVQFKARPLF